MVVSTSAQSLADVHFTAPRFTICTAQNRPVALPLLASNSILSVWSRRAIVVDGGHCVDYRKSTPSSEPRLKDRLTTISVFEMDALMMFYSLTELAIAYTTTDNMPSQLTSDLTRRRSSLWQIPQQEC